MGKHAPYSGDGKGQPFAPELGSQVLVGYEQGWAKLPVALGNLFHPHNKQQVKYTTPQNQLKGMQTAGGNKVVMSDKQGQQTILIRAFLLSAILRMVLRKATSALRHHRTGYFTI